MTTSVSPNTGVAVATKAVQIVGFAPSWIETPWDNGAHLWGMNALHKVAGDRPWTAWFQLHDIDKHHKDDRAEHIAWLRDSNLPIYMWEHHLPRYQAEIPNAVPYPKDAILAHFGNYFTNTVSWMIALAIVGGYQDIGVFGIDMAQDSEYAHQRPSCEFFLGWAAGAGIRLAIPKTSDLLKASYLYGAEEEDASVLRAKYESRLKELVERKGQMERDFNNLQAALNQIVGAIENTQYFLRAWSQPNLDGANAGVAK